MRLISRRLRKRTPCTGPTSLKMVGRYCMSNSWAIGWGPLESRQIVLVKVEALRAAGPTVKS